MPLLQLHTCRHTIHDWKHFYIVIIKNVYALILIQTFATQHCLSRLWRTIYKRWMQTYKHLCGSKQGSTSQCEGQGQLSGDVWLTALPSTSLISPHLIHSLHYTTPPHPPHPKSSFDHLASPHPSQQPYPHHLHYQPPHPIYPISSSTTAYLTHQKQSDSLYTYMRTSHCRHNPWLG